MAVVLRFGGQRLRFGGDNMMWSGHIPHFHTKLIIERAFQVGAQLPSKLIELDLYVRDMYPIWMEYHDLYHRYRGDGDVLFKSINLANPDWPLATPYGGLTWTEEGVIGNGVNGYIDTGFNPSLLVSGQKYQLDDAHQAAVINVPYASTHNISGNTIPGDNSFVNSISAAQRINQGVNVLNVSVDLTGIGFKMNSRTTRNDLFLVNQDVAIAARRTSTYLPNSQSTVLRGGSNYGDLAISVYSLGKAIPYSISQDIRAIENADMARLGLPQIA